MDQETTEGVEIRRIKEIELVCNSEDTSHCIESSVLQKTNTQIDCHFVKEKVLSGDIVTKFVWSNDLLTDIFTSP